MDEQQGTVYFGIIAIRDLVDKVVGSAGSEFLGSVVERIRLGWIHGGSMSSLDHGETRYFYMLPGGARQAVHAVIMTSHPSL